ncbi:MAG: hypothetical protein R3Y24_07070 [Eubacteriales bacterium]
MNEYNFNAHLIKKLINKYGGSERKETIVLDDGYEYLLKLPDPTREKKRMLSYINNTVSEYIGCKIMEQLKFSVQKVILGEYITISSKGEEQKYIACACRNIEGVGNSLAEAERTTLGSDENTRTGVLPSFETIKEIAKYTPDISLDEIEKFYAQMFIGDAFIGNRDRHNGNWGFLTGIKDSQIAPIYDCGSSLCPMYDDTQLTDTVARNEANNGLSVIKDNKGKQIVYKDFLFEAKNENVNHALKTI